MRVAAIACALAAVVAGCGSNGSGGSDRADAARQAAADAGLSVAVQDFFALSTRAPDATYVVHYTVTAADAQAPAYAVIVSQRPPDRRFDVISPDGTIDSTIRRGDETFQCQKHGDEWKCAPTQTDDPGAGAVDPDLVSATAKALTAQKDDYDFAVESRELAGVNATCLVTTPKEGAAESVKAATFCLSSEGAPLFVETAGQALAATSYTTEIADDAFELPSEPPEDGQG